MIRTTNSKIVKAIAGTIVEMHPYHNPENMDKIMTHVVKQLDNKYYLETKKNDSFQLFNFKDREELHSFIQELLNIKEFKDLNISKYLKEQGVTDADDERNSGISFTSRYDRRNIEYRQYDFIDLDACTRNIAIEIDIISEEHDCFLCKHAENYGSTKPSNCKTCITCINNPIYTNNQEFHSMALKPKNEWTDEENKLYNLE